MRGLDPRTHLPEQFPLDGLPDSSRSSRGQVPDQVRDRRPAMSKVEPMPARLFLCSGDRGPALLFQAVLSVRSAARKPALFTRAIDLGCGTGLAATAFARGVDHFIGIDLSPRMIEQARATGLYAQLEVSEMLEGLRG